MYNLFIWLSYFYVSRDIMTSFICNLQPENPGSFDLSAESCFRRVLIFLASWTLTQLKKKSVHDCNNPVQFAASGKKIKTFLGRTSTAIMSVTVKHNA